MYARVARFEKGSKEAIEAALKDMASRAEGGPPDGVPATGFTFLGSGDEGRVLAITFFETEEDMRQGDEALSAMTPPGEGMGDRVSVETYEVGVDVRA